MHVGFIALDYPSAAGGSGVGNQVRTLGISLVQSGHSVTVISLAEPTLPASENDNGVQVYRVARGPFHWYASKLPGIGPALALVVRELEDGWAVYRLIRRLHREHPFDVLEGTETGTILVALCQRDHPLVTRLHGELYTFRKYASDAPLTMGIRLSRVVQRVGIRSSKRLISPSNAHAAEIASELGRRCPPIEVIPNATHTLSETPLLTPSLSHSPARTLVLCVGRLQLEKGTTNLLAAAGQVIRSRPNVHFVLAGARHPSLPDQEIGELMRRFSLDENVSIVGHVSHSELMALYRKASVCVVPSHYETFGLAALEAMALGVPVVATSAGALPELIDHEFTGLLVSSNDPSALAASILRLLADGALRRRLATNARNAARDRFTVEKHRDASLEVYASVVGGRQGHPEAAEHIFVSPHFDDVALSCGGFVAALRERRRNVRVITIFASKTDSSTWSAFARHMRRKWKTGDTRAERMAEDAEACRLLCVSELMHWEFVEAPYRLDEVGLPLYTSYAELRGDVKAEDRKVEDEVYASFEEMLAGWTVPPILYFPLSLGGHIDHQILFRVGFRLRSCGHMVMFYEDWPYAEEFRISRTPKWWSSREEDIRVDRKIEAVMAYQSQLGGLGGSRKSITKRIERYASRVGSGCSRERYWELPAPEAARILQGDIALRLPFIRRKWRVSSRTLSAWLSGSFLELEDLLPPGDGIALNLSGDDHGTILTHRGYQVLSPAKPVSPWDPVSRRPTSLPHGTQSLSVLLVRPWVKAVDELESLVDDAVRSLLPGGVMCGALSLAAGERARATDGSVCNQLRLLMERHGFVDVEVYSRAPQVILDVRASLRCHLTPKAQRLLGPLLDGAFLSVFWLPRLLIACLPMRGGHVADGLSCRFAKTYVFVARKAAGRSPAHWEGGNRSPDDRGHLPLRSGSGRAESGIIRRFQGL